MVAVPALKQTPLYSLHVRSNAKILPFAGWMMPIEYRSVLEEHRLVRTDKGVFDLSHMGEIEISGPGAVSFLDRLVTNRVDSLRENQALYTVICREDGGVLDDLVIYRLPEKYLLVVNASNIEKIVRWLTEQSSQTSGTKILNRSDELALLAIQGPNAESFLQSLCSVPLDKLSYYFSCAGKIADVPGIISRTGYTGEDGFEFYVEAEAAPRVWSILLEKGILPVGLAARDSLRLEAGYLLYGNDMDETTTPLEVGLSWVVKLDKNDFVGKPALLHQKSEGVARKLVPFSMQDRAIPRHGYPVFFSGKPIGKVTSGGFSPSLEKGVGFAFVETSHASFSGKPGEEFQVEIRGQLHVAVVSKKPFVKGSVKVGA